MTVDISSGINPLINARQGQAAQVTQGTAMMGQSIKQAGNALGEGLHGIAERRRKEQEAEKAKNAVKALAAKMGMNTDGPEWDDPQTAQAAIRKHVEEQTNSAFGVESSAPTGPPPAGPPAMDAGAPPSPPGGGLDQSPGTMASMVSPPPAAPPQGPPAGAAPPMGGPSPMPAGPQPSAPGRIGGNAAVLSPELQMKAAGARKASLAEQAWTNINKPKPPVDASSLSMPGVDGGPSISPPSGVKLQPSPKTPEEIGREFDASGFGTPGKFTYEAKPLDESVVERNRAQADAARQRPAIEATKEQGRMDRAGMRSSTEDRKLAVQKAFNEAKAEHMKNGDANDVAEAKARQELGMAKLDETKRHDVETEKTGNARVEQARKELENKIAGLPAVEALKTVRAEMAAESRNPAGPDADRMKVLEDKSAELTKQLPRGEGDQGGDVQITPEEAKAELARRRAAKGPK